MKKYYRLIEDCDYEPSVELLDRLLWWGFENIIYEDSPRYVHMSDYRGVGQKCDMRYGNLLVRLDYEFVEIYWRSTGVYSKSSINESLLLELKSIPEWRDTDYVKSIILKNTSLKKIPTDAIATLDDLHTDH